MADNNSSNAIINLRRDLDKELRQMNINLNRIATSLGVITKKLEDEKPENQKNHCDGCEFLKLDSDEYCVTSMGRF